MIKIIIEAAVALVILWIFGFTILPALAVATGQSSFLFSGLLVAVGVAIVIAVFAKLTG